MMGGQGGQFFDRAGIFAASHLPENLEPRIRRSRSSWRGTIIGLFLIAVIGMVVVFDLMPASKQVEVIMSEEGVCDISGRTASYDLSRFATEDALLDGFESFKVDLDLYEAGTMQGHKRLKVEPGGFEGLGISKSFGHGVSPTCRITIFGIK